MKLPRLEHSVYTMTIPSSQKEVQYRPYTVGEEKILLTASETDNTKEITGAIKKLIEVCTFEQLDVSELTSYDVEYAFLKIRSQSVGENIELTYRVQTCPNNDNEPCKDSINMAISVDDIQIMKLDEDDKYVSLNDPNVSDDFRATEKILKLDSVISIKITHPSIDTIAAVEGLDDPIEIERELLANIIKEVHDVENVYTDFTKEECIEFASQMTAGQRQKILDFIESIPVLRYENTYKCKKCGFQEDIVLEGLQSFFV